MTTITENTKKELERKYAKISKSFLRRKRQKVKKSSSKISKFI